MKLSFCSYALVFPLSVLLACGDDGTGTPDATSADANPSGDSGPLDTAEAPDAEPSDTGASVDVGPVDAGNPPAPGCTAPTGTGTEHQGVISASETWTAADSPHVVIADVTVATGTVTIEPCAVVRLRPGRFITVSGSAGPATLRAHGEAILNDDQTTTIRPITFLPDTAGTFWGSLMVLEDGLLSLEHANLSRGGSHATAVNQGGTVVAIGAGGPGFTRNLHTISVLIEDSEGFGVNIQNFAGFTDNSEPLTIRGSGQNPSPTNVATDYPISITPPAVHTIPTGVYTGNAIDAIRVYNAGNVLADEAFRSHGVPYHLQGEFLMRPVLSAAQGGLLTLRIEAGVTIQMEPGRSFDIGSSSGTAPSNIWPVRVIAQGGPDAPITFTTSVAVAGMWPGITWAGGPPTGNQMTYVHIEYAGADSGSSGFGCGPSDNDAALIIELWRPDDAFIQNMTISDSLSGGIVSGWVSDQNGPNLKTGNTFMNLGSTCHVSRWANMTAPRCPGNDNVADCL